MDPPPLNDRAGLIAALVADNGEWLVNRCAKAAGSRTGIDAKDGYQQTIERLLKASMEVDPGNQGLRTYLGRCVDWVTHNLADERARHGGNDLPPEKLDAELERSSTEAPHDPPGDLGELIAPARLSAPQSDAVINCCGDRMTAREFAQLVGRSHDQVRKDKERGLTRLRTWLDLTPDEERVFVAIRLHTTVPGVADLLEMSEPTVREHLVSAQQKIDRKFNREED